MVRLMNPVDAIAEAIAQPLEEAAREWRKLANMHERANTDLLKQGHMLEATLGGDIAQPFADMISKQHRYTYGIVEAINEIAGFYDKGAEMVRDAARVLGSVIGPYFNIINWVLDRVTPDIIMEQGESPIHAAFDDLRNTIHSLIDDGGSFFGDLFHLRFSDALDDATDVVEGMAHLAGDALAIIADVEPLLCQWATEIMRAVNWCFNQVNSLLNKATDWLLGFSEMASDAAILADPNATTEEKALAGTMLGVNIVLDILIFIPGAQEAILARLGIKFVARWIAAQIAKSIVGRVIKNLTKRLLAKYAELAVKRALERSLTKAVLQNLERDLKPQISAYTQKILEKWSAGEITLAQAHAEIQALVDFADKYGVDRLMYILKNYDAESLRVVLNGDHLPPIHPDQLWEAWHFGPNRLGTTVPRNFILRVGSTTYYVNANATKHLAEYVLSKSNKTGYFGFPIGTFAAVIEQAQKQGLLKAGTGKQFFRIGPWEIGIDTNEHVIYHLVYRP